MERIGERLLVSYRDDQGRLSEKTADTGCLTAVLSILSHYDFPSWRDAAAESLHEANTNVLEVTYESGKTYRICCEKAQKEAGEMYSVLQSCLMEYAGIVK